MTATNHTVTAFDASKVVITRKRFSVTQGEVLVEYAGVRIEQYGDKIELRDGAWAGYDDAFWMDVAKREAIARGLAIDPTPPTPAALIETALDASAEAAFAALSRLGGDRGDCGNAFVIITARKGRKALVAALAARNIRTSRHHEGGVSVHILGNLPAQSRLPYEKGCDAFVSTLEAAGIEAHTYSYAD